MVNLTIRRIEKARITAMRARNQSFKDYWNDVADKLELKLKTDG